MKTHNKTERGKRSRRDSSSLSNRLKNQSRSRSRDHARKLYRDRSPVDKALRRGRNTSRATDIARRIDRDWRDGQGDYYRPCGVTSYHQESPSSRGVNSSDFYRPTYTGVRANVTTSTRSPPSRESISDEKPQETQNMGPVNSKFTAYVLRTTQWSELRDRQREFPHQNVFRRVPSQILGLGTTSIPSVRNKSS